jgi:hypothetical protein
MLRLHAQMIPALVGDHLAFDVPTHSFRYQCPDSDANAADRSCGSLSVAITSPFKAVTNLYGLLL